MKIKKPKFWDYKKPNVLSFLLLPFTILIKINNFFNQFYKSITVTNNNYSIKTICVGNIYVGGTGKTPSVIKINKLLKKLKYKTIFIKKFYTESLDEYRLLKKNGDILSDLRRVKSLDSANKSYHVAIFDDGLQDSSINYDLKFVCFNTRNFIGNGMLIPAGPLREKISSLKKYDAVLLNGNNENTDQIIMEIKKQNKSISIFESAYSLTNLNIFDIKSKYVAFAGIGIPMNFYTTLINHNINIVKFLEYPDHYIYKDNDIKRIKDIARGMNAKVITTEKDYSRLEMNNNILLKEDIQYTKMELKIKNESKLIAFIQKNI